MIALVVFLLCGLAGVTAFLMASTNAGRYAHADEQEYYSVSSATLMLVDMLDGLTYESPQIAYDYERAWDYTGNQHSSTDHYMLTIPDTAGTLSGADTVRGSSLELCPTIGRQCDLLLRYLNVPEEWYARVREQADAPQKPAAVAAVSYPFTVQVPGDGKYGTVYGRLAMYDNYDLSFTFTTSASASGEDAGEYAMTVYWAASVTPTQVAGTPQYVYADGAAIVGGEYTKGTMTQQHTLNVTVRWDKAKATISRGAIANE